MGATAVETLAAGDADAPPRRWPALAGWLAAALLVVGALGAAIAEGPIRSRSADAISVAASDVRASADRAEGLVLSRVAYASPALTSVAVDEAVRADLRALVGQAAAEGSAAVRAAEEDVATIAVLPWQSDLVAAREAVRAYARARAEALESVAGDPADRSPLAPDPVAEAALADALESLGGGAPS